MSQALIYGEKIVLRPYRAEDAQTLYESVQEPIGRRLTGTHQHFSMEQIERYLARYIDSTPEDRLGYIIAQPDTLAALGEVVILDIDPDNHSAGIRIALFSPDDFGKGYGTEAMRLMLAQAFQTLKLHRLALEVYDFNPRAQRVYEKVGFRREGLLRDALFYDGEYHDTIVMSILAHEWQP